MTDRWPCMCVKHSCWRYLQIAVLVAAIVAVSFAHVETIAAATATPVNAPSNLTATLTANPTRIRLNAQDNATNETGFIIERSVNGGAFAQVYAAGARAGTGPLTWTDSDVATVGTYTYRMKAIRGPDSSPWSNTASASVTSAGTATLTRTPTGIATLTSTPAATSASTATKTSAATATKTATATATQTSLPGITSSPTSTPSATATTFVTTTATVTATATLQAVATGTPTIEALPTALPTSTDGGDVFDLNGTSPLAYVPNSGTIPAPNGNATPTPFAVPKRIGVSFTSFSRPAPVPTRPSITWTLRNFLAGLVATPAAASKNGIPGIAGLPGLPNPLAGSQAAREAVQDGQPNGTSVNAVDELAGGTEDVPNDATAPAMAVENDRTDRTALLLRAGIDLGTAGLFLGSCMLGLASVYFYWRPRIR